MKLRELDQVNISGAAGRVVGRVEAVLNPHALLLLDGMDEQQVLEVQHALGSMEVDEVALISHVHNMRRVLFAALHHTPDDGWYDLKRQRLEITAWATT